MRVKRAFNSYWLDNYIEWKFSAVLARYLLKSARGLENGIFPCQCCRQPSTVHRPRWCSRSREAIAGGWKSCSGTRQSSRYSGLHCPRMGPPLHTPPDPLCRFLQQNVPQCPTEVWTPLYLTSVMNPLQHETHRPRMKPPLHTPPEP